jgi:tetratricopeptide (TPR) repeat protein
MVVASLALALFGMTPGKIDIQLKDFKEGESISRPRTLAVTVDSSSPVNQVEFYVGNSLRSSDSSTPYEFQIDPLNETEGNLKVTFAAYTSDGQNAKKEVTLKIDSGVSLGAQANVDKGNAALTENKNDDAIYFGRVALKATEGFAPARILLSRAYLRKGVYDKAQTFAEDALKADPNSDEANTVLAGIGLRKAFSTLSSGNRKETLENINASLLKGVGARRRVMERQMDALPAATDATLVSWSKAAIRNQRYRAAINAILPVFRKSENDPNLGNLLAYAQMRNGDMNAATYTIAGLERNRAMDGYSYALKSIILVGQGKDADADAAMSEAIGNDPDSLAIKLAQAHIALKRNRLTALSTLIQGLARDEGQRPEVNYYLSVLLDRQGNFPDADRRFLDAVLAEPALYDAMIERGNQSILPLINNRITDEAQKQYQIDLAGAYYRAALEAKGDSPAALTGLMIYNTAIKKMDEAAKYADAAIAAGPEYPAAHFGASMVYTAVQMQYGDQVNKMRTGRSLTTEQLREVNKLENLSDEYRRKADTARKKAIALDPTYLEGRFTPTVQVVFGYYMQHARQPLLVLP